MKLLDTSVAIDHLRGSPEAVELLSGLVEAEELLLASEEVARRAGELAQTHRRSHSGIDDADYLIAATALLLEADLLTTNVRRFPMIAGLEPAY